MKVSIIGQGYVGQSLAMAAAQANLSVIGLDVNSQLISNLSQGKSFVPGVTTDLLDDKLSSGTYLPTSNPKVLKDSDIIVICVPTPLNSDRQPDLHALLDACKLIAENVTSPALIISESTSFPGTLRNIIRHTIEKNSRVSFQYAIAPERVDPGNLIWSIKNTPRIISGLTEQAKIDAQSFYSKFCDEVLVVSSPEVAEAAKLLENTFRQVNIALVNEFSEVLNTIGISASEVVSAAATKPFGFLKFRPSIGVGGHCIPVDSEYFTYFAKINGIVSRFAEVANQVNFQRPMYIVELIKKFFSGDIAGKVIQIVGIAYKSNLSDVRESPAIELIKNLRSSGAIVIWHDPIVEEWNGEYSTALNDQIDLGLIITPHNGIDFNLWKISNTNVFDLSIDEKSFGWDKIL